MGKRQFFLDYSLISFQSEISIFGFVTQTASLPVEGMLKIQKR